MWFEDDFVGGERDGRKAGKVGLQMPGSMGLG